MVFEELGYEQYVEDGNVYYDKELNDIMKIEDSLDRSITLFLWIQRSQMFLDGNKRVANLVANKEMIKNETSFKIIQREY